MHGSRYWTDGDWEYTFLAPQGNINESDKSKLLAVLKKFDKTLYVRSDSDSSDWREVKKTIKMPTLETSGEKTGWTLSSEKHILSDKGILDQLAKDLKSAGCECNFTVIDEEPKEIYDGSIDKKSKKQSKSGQTNKPKSNKVKAGKGVQEQTIRKLENDRKSNEASTKHNLTPCMLIAKDTKNKTKTNKAWVLIGKFIKENKQDAYKDAKPLKYGKHKNWHNWHRGVRSFVNEGDKNFWFIRLDQRMKTELEKILEPAGFEIRVPGGIAAPSNKVSDLRELVGSAKSSDDMGIEALGSNSLTIDNTNAKLNDDSKPKHESNQNGSVTTLYGNKNSLRPTPGVHTASPEDIAEPEVKVSGRADLMADIIKGVKLNKTEKGKSESKTERRDEPYDVSGLTSIMAKRRKDIAQNTAKGESNNPIARLLTKRDQGEFIFGLKLTKPGADVLDSLDGNPMCGENTNAMLIKRADDNRGLDPSQWLDAEEYKEYMLNSEIGKLAWLVLVDSELTEDVPSEDELVALLDMQKEIKSMGLEFAKVTHEDKLENETDPDIQEVKKNKTPPPLPQRNAKSAPVPKGFVTLDSLQPKPNKRNVKTLVLVNYDNIRNSKELMMDLRYKLKKSTRKYEAFDVNKANKTLSEFKNGTLIGARGMKDAKNYRNVLANPVFDNYKANAGSYIVALWNLDIPEDTPDADIAKLRDELAKCGIAIRKDWRKSKV